MQENIINDSDFAYISENLKLIRENIEKAALSVGRKGDSVKLMAVTKNVEADKINYAVSQGIKFIGENRVQEYLSKKDKLNLSNCDAHLIGHLQTNKVRQILGEVDMIQSVDSLKIGKEISKRSINQEFKTEVLIEVNVGGEESKFGFTAEEVTEKIYELSEEKGLIIKGLMSVIPISDNKLNQREYFSRIERLFVDIRSKKIDNVCMEILSMGMSGDYYEAIQEGSNLVRIGSLIFGERKY